MTLIPRSLIACLVVVFLSIDNASSALPNFVVILADDLGYGDVSTYQESQVATPNIDRLAKEGMLFGNMRANCTVCSPTRAALLTGRYADLVGVPGVIRTDPENSWGYFAPDAVTLADELGEAGYHTGLVGKWHLGLSSPNLPNERGFEHFHGFLGDMMDSYTNHERHGHNYMRLNEKTIEPEGHATDLFSRWACDYILTQSKNAKQPFFLYLAYNAPHFPIEPPKDWLQRVSERSPDLEKSRAKNVAFVEHLDAGIGKVLDCLEASGCASNTLVVFTSDNGGALRYFQNNDPWRGGKQSHYDGGLRVPFVIRWPEKIQPASTSDYQGLVFDVYPTLVELAGLKPAEILDAESLVPIFSGQPMEGVRDLYFTRREGGMAYGGKSYQALIRGKWKILQNDPYSPLELYNLKKDPDEINNLVESEPAVFLELAGALRGHVRRSGLQKWQPPEE